MPVVTIDGSEAIQVVFKVESDVFLQTGEKRKKREVREGGRGEVGLV